ncbi:anthranilate synthase / indole-3-glycerol phosphate synthase [Polyrhizophydium stewartii]|uniref:Multifunctional tryptophan biosynthesis protein n=1 Tax=Polyrhizophydium stewartii TaxID=2732419 RepID=A0ABR4NK68_9FUNG|nr:bifunctional tryptophan synthase trp1 [Polyrhizophydium stewartii]
MTTLLIDNYDSFTWNVYQLLSELGADVRVFRNDEITVEQAAALSPRNVVISPGPGHPSGAGVSNAIIRHFAGKVPVLGVCLGEQCMYEIYGGTVTYAGELVHGKTTPVAHDGQGLFEGVPQHIECTRYHSLAGDPRTLPAALRITARTPSGVVMGVRHRELVVEGVQFHPESIASEGGRRMFANFLSWEGGSWATLRRRHDLVHFDASADAAAAAAAAAGDLSAGAVGAGISLAAISKLNSTGAPVPAAAAAAAAPDGPAAVAAAPSAGAAPSILRTITDRRVRDVAEAAAKPGASFLHLQRSLALGLAPPVIDFRERLLAALADPDADPDEDGPAEVPGAVAVLAEIKRASPSKGAIDIDAHAATQARVYAAAGAAAISVLTEPTWFKGSLADMQQARAAVADMPNRPAILRKDFIVDRYQVLEARLHGADAVLLIVACLDDAQLAGLLAYSRELGMEPLVEVATAGEMQRAVRVGARVIGVNNRDLNTFTVDAARTTQLAGLVPADTLLVALSGIAARADIAPYLRAGARGVLVGEALMRAADKAAFIAALRDPSVPYDASGAAGLRAPAAAAADPHPQRVKVCGLTTERDAVAAADAGADFLGLIFAPGSPREVTPAKAAAIVAAVRDATNTHRAATLLARVHATTFPTSAPAIPSPAEWFAARAAPGVLPRRSPLFVGVFTTQTAHEIQRIVEAVGLDLVQLHGASPDPDIPALISVPVIQVLHVRPATTADELVARATAFAHRASFLMFDAAPAAGVLGGSGVAFDWSVAAKAVQTLQVPVFLAGGLHEANVADAVRAIKPWCVDVCSGVEADGQKGVKDHARLAGFLAAARQ